MKLRISIFTLLVLLNSHVMSAKDYKKKYQYLSPLPSAAQVSPTATIIVRFDGISPDALVNLSTFIQVRGEKSGSHSGQTVIAMDKKTIIFKPTFHFSEGEIVAVALSPAFNQACQSGIESFHYRFSVAQTAVYSQNQLSNNALQFSHNGKMNSLRESSTGQAMIMKNGVSVPSDFPRVNISINANPDSNYIFIDNRGGGGKPFNVIFNNSGDPIWYLKTSDERRDFKVQPNGWITMMIRDGYGGSGWGFIALNNNYEYVKTFRTTNGYSTDEHELKVLPDGGYLIIGLQNTTVDMSRYVTGGQRNATVSETCIEEFTANDELIFQWRAWDHFDIQDVDLEDLTGSYIRFPHMNAIDLDSDGHILLSCRHISEVTKINRQTGDIIWRLGGAHNQFNFINDPLGGFKNQHTVRLVGKNRYTIFDNGDLHNPSVSRAIEYELDTSNMTATLVWEFRDNPDKYSHYMGNVQRLPNGNTLINWAVPNLPKLTEVRPDGSKAFEMNFVDQWECYRVHRCAWNGMAKTPYLIVEPQYNNITLLFNKFGDPNVDYYKIFGGVSTNSTTLLDTSKLTLKRITNLPNNTRVYFRVRAVDKAGQESGFSNEESALVNFIAPGQNTVLNGDFSKAKDSWTWEVTSSASATWNIESGVSHFNITNGGSDIYAIQLRQNGVALVQGSKYVFEFDARADISRIIEAKVGQDVSPWTNYSKIGLTSITPAWKHYSFTFIMEDLTDYNTRVVINTGTSDADVYIDNISLKEINGTKVKDILSSVSSQYELVGNYPNPFNNATNITFYLLQTSQVVIRIYNVRGELIQKFIDQPFGSGEHSLYFNASQLSTGVYFYKFEAYSFISEKLFSSVKKMLLIK